MLFKKAFKIQLRQKKLDSYFQFIKYHAFICWQIL